MARRGHGRRKLERASDGHLLPKDARPSLEERERRAREEPGAVDLASDERRGRELSHEADRMIAEQRRRDQVAEEQRAARQRLADWERGPQS